MSWLVWRQFRSQAIVVFGGLAILAVLLLVTGLQLRHWYDTNGIAACNATGDCDAAVAAFSAHYSWLQTLLDDILLLLLPAVTGVFWGAPLLARELETGTFRLAWTQSVTRRRWLSAKIAIVGLASVVASGLLSLLVTWWSVPLDKVSGGKFGSSVFQVRDIVPAGYAAFGFALGVTAGLLIRRVLPAMASTLVGYIAARVVVLLWVRPHLNAPLHATGPLLQPSAPGRGPSAAPPAGDLLTKPGDWVISSHVVDPAGRVTDTIKVSPDEACFATKSCLNGYYRTLSYQPANRYWPFQLYETAIFAVAALLLIWFCFWWITDRRPRRRHASSSGTDGAIAALAGR